MDEGGGPAEGADAATRDEGGEEVEEEEREGKGDGGAVEVDMNGEGESEEEEEEGAAVSGPRDTVKVTVLSYQKTDNDYTYDIEVLTTPTTLPQGVYQ